MGWLQHALNGIGELHYWRRLLLGDGPDDKTDCFPVTNLCIQEHGHIVPSPESRNTYWL